jgi:hypothetical protein
MPKILITGNGFDLNIGLPTLYSDFINVLKFIQENDVYHFENIYSQTSHFSTIQSNFSTFEINSSQVEELKILLKNNLWFSFFKDEFEIETWIDFENKIEYVLNLFFSAIGYLRDNIFLKQPLDDQPQFMYNMDLFNNNIEIIQILKTFKIIDFNGRHITLLKTHLIKKYNYFIDIDLDKITKDLYQELIGFKLIFNYYFEYFVFPLYAQFKLKMNQSQFSKIDKHYTFNYTPTFEEIYKKVNITQFLHGRINSKSNQMVLGISDLPNSSSVDQKYFIPFTKYFQKLNNDTDYVFIKEYEHSLDDNYVFFFWGHSLDKSDEDYINEVFNFIGISKSPIRKIVVVYHNKTSKAKLLVNLLNIRGKQNIQNLMRDGILVFMQADSPDLQLEFDSDIQRQFVF